MKKKKIVSISIFAIHFFLGFLVCYILLSIMYNRGEGKKEEKKPCLEFSIGKKIKKENEPIKGPFQ